MRPQHIPEFLFYVGVLLFTIFYSVPRHYTRVPYSVVLWHRDMTSLGPIERETEGVEYPDFSTRHYFFKNRLFYYDRSGEALHVLKLDPGNYVSASYKNYVVYQKVGKEINVYGSDGAKLWSMDTFSYPILSPSGNRLFLLSTDCSMISIWDQNRNPLLTNTFMGTMVTDYAWCTFNDDLIIGTIEGEVSVFDYKGKPQFRETIKGSKYNYIKSVATSKSGQMFATLSGLYPEILTCFSRKGNVLWKEKTDYSRRHRVSLFIDEDNKILVEQLPAGVQVRDLENGNILYSFAFNVFQLKRVDYLIYQSVPGYFLVLVTGDNGNYGFFSDVQGRIIWKKDFVEPYFVGGEIHPDRKSILIQTSGNMYAYQLRNYF